MNGKADLSQFVRAETLSKDLGIPLHLVKGWTYKGAPVVRVGRVWLFHGPSLAEWLLTKQTIREGDV